MQQSTVPRCCYNCGRIYTKRAKGAFAKNGGAITCTKNGCHAEWELPIMIKAILLQPGIIEKTGETGLVVVSSDDMRWTLPSGCVRVNESARDTIDRVAEQDLAIRIPPDSLYDFCTRHDPEERIHLSFYQHATRLHEKRKSSNEASSLSGPKTRLIIQTTDGISFASPIYREVAEKFLLEVWMRQPFF